MRLLSLFLFPLLAALGLGGCAAPSGPTPRLLVECEGVYPKHLQGVCTDYQGHIYWSFTDVLVKTDPNGRLLVRASAPVHQGDLCHVGGRLYVAVNLGRFNGAPGQANSWIHAYDDRSLALVARYPVPEVVHGAGGISHHNGHFFVVGGLPAGVPENYVYEYDRRFRLVRRHILASGHTKMGIQTIAWAHGSWWMGCYGSPPVLLRADEGFDLTGRWYYDAAMGIEQGPDGRFLMGRDIVRPGLGHVGQIDLIDPKDIDLAQGMHRR